jgi:uncharacterized protein with PIN domain
MITAIDSSVLIAIIAGESDAADWVHVLARARAEGALVCCDVVYAEIGAGLGSQAELDRVLIALGLHFDSMQADAAWQAGEIFRQYPSARRSETVFDPGFSRGSPCPSPGRSSRRQGSRLPQALFSCGVLAPAMRQALAGGNRIGILNASPNTQARRSGRSRFLCHRRG